MSHFAMNADSLFAGLGMEIRGLVEPGVCCVEKKPSFSSWQSLWRGVISRFKYTWKNKGAGDKKGSLSKCFQQRQFEFSNQESLDAKLG